MRVLTLTLVAALFAPVGIADPEIARAPDPEQYVRAAHAISNLTIEYAKATANGTDPINNTNDYTQGVIEILLGLDPLDDLSGYICYNFQGAPIEGAWKEHGSVGDGRYSIGIVGFGLDPYFTAGYHWFSTEGRGSDFCVVNALDEYTKTPQVIR